MPVVSIKVCGKDYQVACDNGEEERLHALAYEVDERVQSLSYGMKNRPNEAMGLLLAALMMADELSENKKEIDKLMMENEQLAQRPMELGDEERLAEIEAAVAATMEEIASRIEKIADQVEVS